MDALRVLQQVINPVRLFITRRLEDLTAVAARDLRLLAGQLEVLCDEAVHLGGLADGHLLPLDLHREQLFVLLSFAVPQVLDVSHREKNVVKYCEVRFQREVVERRPRLSRRLLLRTDAQRLSLVRRFLHTPELLFEVHIPAVVVADVVREVVVFHLVAKLFVRKDLVVVQLVQQLAPRVLLEHAVSHHHALRRLWRVDRVGLVLVYFEELVTFLVSAFWIA
mmetsp:Transcript_42864/g.50265  ORF Transcript_42864/g.50265 Transcript_42864/m.50265 type:complete len:222 (+) Transcript_42864:891-1556(+)